MLNSQKITHIVIGLFLSLLYSCLVGQLLHPSEYALVILAVYFCIFLTYTLKTYAAFHYPPTQPNFPPTKINISLIFKYKLNQERKREVEELLAQHHNKKDSYLEQYIKLMKSPSFCDNCQFLQPPRSHHCLQCQACIMGHHFHSQLLGFCIGQSNQKIYLSYLLITTILGLYCLLTLLLVSSVGDNFNKLQLTTQTLFFLLFGIYAVGTCVFGFYFKQFFCLLRNNKTYPESQNKALTGLSIFEKRKGEQTITFTTVLKDLANCDTLGEVSSWMLEAEALNEEQ